MTEPKIVCIGVIGRDVSAASVEYDIETYHNPKNNPLHMSLFPPHMDSKIEFSFLLNSCLDIFDIREKQTAIDQDLGLLQALDERLAAYGWLTNTGIKFIVVVDLFGQPGPIGAKEPKGSAVPGLRDSDLKPVRCIALTMSFMTLFFIDCFSYLLVRQGRKCCLLISKQVFQALQTAYVHLLQNPFYSPNEHVPIDKTAAPTSINLRTKFATEIKRIGDTWAAGVTTV